MPLNLACLGVLGGHGRVRVGHARRSAAEAVLRRRSRLARRYTSESMHAHLRKFMKKHPAAAQKKCRGATPSGRLQGSNE